MKNFKNQYSFEKTSDGSVKLSNNGKIKFSEGEKVKNAEILQVLYIVQKGSHSDQQMVTNGFSRFQNSRTFIATRNSSKICIAVWYCTLC